MAAYSECLLQASISQDTRYRTDAAGRAFAPRPEAPYAPRLLIGAYSAMSLRSDPSLAKRTTTIPPGSTPVTTPSPKAAWTTSSPVPKSALGASVRGAAHDGTRDAPSVDFGTGDDVVHAAFGEGVVTGVEPGGIVVVRFAKDGAERKLMAEYAPISKR